jgi:hypothetical protein
MLEHRPGDDHVHAPVGQRYRAISREHDGLVDQRIVQDRGIDVGANQLLALAFEAGEAELERAFAQSPGPEPKSRTVISSRSGALTRAKKMTRWSYRVNPPPRISG